MSSIIFIVGGQCVPGNGIDIGLRQLRILYQKPGNKLVLQIVRQALQVGCLDLRCREAHIFFHSVKDWADLRIAQDKRIVLRNFHLCISLHYSYFEKGKYLLFIFPCYHVVHHCQSKLRNGQKSEYPAKLHASAVKMTVADDSKTDCGRSGTGLPLQKSAGAAS